MHGIILIRMKHPSEALVVKGGCELDLHSREGLGLHLHQESLRSIGATPARQEGTERFMLQAVFSCHLSPARFFSCAQTSGIY